MGFGWLFIGYFVTFLTSLLPNIYGVLLRLVGYVVMYIGLLKLSEYNRKFKYTAMSVIPAALVAAYRICAAFAGIMSVESPIFSDTVSSFVGYGDISFIFLFHLALTVAVKSIADETGLSKIAVAAVRNFIFFCLYVLVYIVANIPGIVSDEYVRWFTYTLFLLQFVWMIFNFIMLITCYKNICPEGDEDMPRKKSRFKWINDFNDELDRREEKARESQLAYRKEKLEKRNRKRKKK